MTAMRLGNALIFAGLVGLVCLLGTQMAGRSPASSPPPAWSSMPRLFFHGHLTALDVPVAFAWLLTVWLFWRWTWRRERPVAGSAAGAGLAYGLALGTKNTSFILPGVLLLWMLLFRRSTPGICPAGRHGDLGVAGLLSSPGPGSTATCPAT